MFYRDNCTTRAGTRVLMSRCYFRIVARIATLYYSMNDKINSNNRGFTPIIDNNRECNKCQVCKRKLDKNDRELFLKLRIEKI